MLKDFTNKAVRDFATALIEEGISARIIAEALTTAGASAYALAGNEEFAVSLAKLVALEAVQAELNG